MATDIVPNASGASGRPVNPRASNNKGVYYTPPSTIKTVPGVQRSEANCTCDAFVGRAEDLAAAGLLPLDRFPGYDGVRSTSVSLRPIGAVKPEDGCWQHVPGYMHVVRQASGRFRVTLNVSAEECARRKLARQKQQEQRETEAATLWGVVPDPLRELCEMHMERFGPYKAEQLWSSPAWTRSNAVEDVAPVMRVALQIGQIVWRAKRFGVTEEDARAALSLMPAFRTEDAARRRLPIAARPTHLRLVWSAGSASP